MHCYAFVMLYLKDGPIISLLNVCFNILQEISNTKGEKEGGERGAGEEEEDEEGGNFKFSFVFFCKYFI